MEMMLEVVIVMLVMEVDKVANEVADMDFEKVTDMVLQINDEYFTHVLPTIDDTFGNAVRGGAGHGGSGR